jgi:aminoglycoside 6'-N-acetyltransferase I
MNREPAERKQPGPAGLLFRLLGADDAALLSRVADEVFDNAVDPACVAEFLADPRHHMAVALDGATVVGMASAVDYVHPDKPRELWINEVAVAPPYRGAGVASRLLSMLFARGRERGCREAWVGTEHDNVAARALYESLGGQHSSFVMYSFRLADRD